MHPDADSDWLLFQCVRWVPMCLPPSMHVEPLHGVFDCKLNGRTWWKVVRKCSIFKSRHWNVDHWDLRGVVRCCDLRESDLVHRSLGIIPNEKWIQVMHPHPWTSHSMPYSYVLVANIYVNINPRKLHPGSAPSFFGLSLEGYFCPTARARARGCLAGETGQTPFELQIAGSCLHLRHAICRALTGTQGTGLRCFLTRTPVFFVRADGTLCCFDLFCHTVLPQYRLVRPKKYKTKWWVFCRWQGGLELVPDLGSRHWGRGLSRSRRCLGTSPVSWLKDVGAERSINWWWWCWRLDNVWNNFVKVF